MSVSVPFNGVTYTLPSGQDTTWGSQLTAFLQAVGSSALAKSGGTFTLTADADFGATYGLKSNYFKSRTTGIASAGVLRLARTDQISWRNQAGDGNISLGVGADDIPWINDDDIVTATATQTITNKTITNIKDNTRAYAHYTRATAQAIPNTGQTIIDFTTMVLDSRTAVTTGASWKFTVPSGMGGIYQVSAMVHMDSIAGAGQGALYVYKNGSVYTRIGSFPSTALNDSMGGTVLISLAAADYIDIRAAQTSATGDRNLTNDATLNHVSILRTVTDL